MCGQGRGSAAPHHPILPAPGSKGQLTWVQALRVQMQVHRPGSIVAPLLLWTLHVVQITFNTLSKRCIAGTTIGAHTLLCGVCSLFSFFFLICRSSLLIAGLLFSRSGFVCVLGTHLVVFLLATRLLGHLPRGVRTHGFRELRC